MLILNSFFIVLVDYTKVCLHLNGVPWHISVPAKSVTWHKEKDMIGDYEHENIMK
jgi:hypothetical protein